MKKTALIIISCMLLLISNACAINVIYPDEYYSTKVLADDHNSMGMSWDADISKYTLNIFYELRRQTILIEKHNELLAEQNHIMWINTCYGGYGGYFINKSALKSVCENAGYPIWSLS